MHKTIGEAINLLTDKLFVIYDKPEAKNIAKLLFRHLFKTDSLQLQLISRNIFPDDKATLLEKYTQELLTNKPVQYVLGETEFYGLTFKVNEHVLIPRPETEELVQWIMLENKNTNRAILDIGTGSGCIPITLKKYLTDLEVYALDVSVDALAVAKQNAILNNVVIQWIRMDILINTPSLKVDVLVSNPPYVLRSEQKTMQRNVLDFEPHLALFVEEDNALLFYDRIATIGTSILNPKGKIYFEINEKYGNEVKDLLAKSGFTNIQLKKDMFERDRFISAILD